MALEPETDGPAIRALGSLFKVTEVFLWDAAAVDVPEVSPVIIHDDSSTEELVIMDACVKSCSKIEPIVDDFTASLEDMELTRHMNALGLPTSFSTNKERTVMSKKKRMAAEEKSNHAGHKDSTVGVSELTIGTRGEIVCSSNSFQSDTSRSMDDIMANDPSENSHYNVADGNSQPDLHGGEGYADSVKLCINSGNWRSFWDDFYGRNYFYNIETHETTWCPPPGMEHLAFSDTSDKSNGVVTDGVERDVDLCGACDDTKVHDMRELQDKIEIFHEVGNYDSVTSGVLCVQFMNIEKLDSNISCFDGYQINKCSSPPDTCKNLDELEGNAACIRVKEICDEDLCPAPFDSSSLTQNDIDRMILTTMYLILLLNFNHCLQSMRNQLGSEDVSRSDLQLTSMNSKADEVDNCGHLDELEGDITCHEANKISDEILQVPSSNRGTMAAAAVYEELGGSGLQQEYLNPTIDELDGHQNGTSSKKKTKVKRAQAERKMLSNDREEISLSKWYQSQAKKRKKEWWQDYLLTLTNIGGRGICCFPDSMKVLKWTRKDGFLSLLNVFARHHASRCGSGTVIDCFTGVGGNAIQFAKRSNHVIGIDIDPQKIDYAQHNAVIYGVDDRIDFIKGDFFHLAPMLKGDVVFMSPPWGGPDYTKSQIYDITMLKPHDGFFLFKIGRMIASRIVMFLPRNVDLNQLAELALLVNPPWTVEVEKNFLNGKLKAITAYFNILAPQEAHHFAYGSS